MNTSGEGRRPVPLQAVRKAVTPVQVRHIGDNGPGDNGPGDNAVVHDRPDLVATEEPLQILAGGPGQESTPVTVTMRTPGHDFELAVGFLWGEGVLVAPADVHQVRYCEVPRDQPQLYNVVTVRASRELTIVPRAYSTTASCGICGTASLDEVEKACAVLGRDAGGTWPARELLSLPEQLRSGQKVFSTTGGLHAAGLFAWSTTDEASLDRVDRVDRVDLVGPARLLVVREDVGRHNAVDKVVGWAVLAAQVPLGRHVLVVSGRVSFEIVQKAAMAGIAVVVAVSAPTSLAVDAARRLGVTLVGFVREGTGNVYSHPHRVSVDRPT